MKQRIIIGGKELQMQETELINLNIQINDISNISTRNSTYSNSIKIPNTSYNRSVLDTLGMMGSVSRFPYQKVGCQYFRDGIAVITDGYLQINGMNDEYFSVVIYDGIIDLSEAIKDLYLSDLSLSSHVLSEQNYENSFSAVSGYKYAIADYGYIGSKPDFTATEYTLEGQLPSMFVHNLVDLILSEAGFTYEGNIFTDATYKSLLAAPTNGFEITETSLTLSNLASYNSNTLNKFEQNTVPTIYNYVHTWTLGTFFNAGITLVGTTDLRADFTGRVELDLTNTFEVFQGDILIQVKVNGTSIKNIYGSSSSPASNTLTFLVNTNDIITLEVTGIDEYDADIERWVCEFTSSATVLIKQATGGQIVDFNLLYQETKQADFLKDVMQHFGMLVIKDFTQENHLKFTTMQELLSDFTNAEDWTNNLVGITSYNYAVDGFARNNDFKYKYEKDVETFDSDGVLIIDNEHIADNKTLISSISRIRELSYRASGYNILKIPIWEPKEVDGVNTNIPKKTDLTLFTVNAVSDTINYTAYGGATSFTGTVPIMTMADIGYQDFIDNYYSNLALMLNNNKIISVELNLSTIDLYNLDFFKLKYLKQTGKYYYLNSVKSNGGLVKAELIEINN